MMHHLISRNLYLIVEYSESSESPENWGDTLNTIIENPIRLNSRLPTEAYDLIESWTHVLPYYTLHTKICFNRQKNTYRWPDPSDALTIGYNWSNYVQEQMMRKHNQD